MIPGTDIPHAAQTASTSSTHRVRHLSVRLCTGVALPVLSWAYGVPGGLISKGHPLGATGIAQVPIPLCARYAMPRTSTDLAYPKPLRDRYSMPNAGLVCPSIMISPAAIPCPVLT